MIWEWIRVPKQRELQSRGEDRAEHDVVREHRLKVGRDDRCPFCVSCLGQPVSRESLASKSAEELWSRENRGCRRKSKSPRSQKDLVLKWEWKSKEGNQRREAEQTGQQIVRGAGWNSSERQQPSTHAIRTRLLEAVSKEQKEETEEQKNGDGGERIHSDNGKKR